MKRNIEKAYRWLWPAILLIIGAVLAIKSVAGFFPNSDTYFIIETGRYIVENGTVPTINPFVIHEGFGVIIQQWLFDVLIYGIYSIGGWVGIFIYSLIMLTISGAAMYAFFGLYSKNKKLKVILLALCLAAGGGFAAARPTSISFLLCLAVVAIMEQYRRSRTWPILLCLPLISLVTINIHAAMWPMLFVLILPFIFPGNIPDIKTNGVWKGIVAFVKDWLSKWKLVLLGIACMIAVGFINPNGLRGIGYLILSYGSASKGNISELQAPVMLSYHGIWPLISIALLLLYVCKTKRNIDMANFYMATGTLVLALLHSRNLWFLLFGAAPLFLLLLNDAKFVQQKEQKITAVKAIAAFYSVCFVVIIGAVMCSSINLTVKDGGLAPVKAAEYLDDFEKEDIILYTGFNNGAYMEMNGYKVYMDARPELFQKKINGKEDVFEESLAAERGQMDPVEFLNKYKFTHVIIEDGKYLDGFLNAYDGYEKVVDGEGYSLYQRCDWAP